MIAISTPVVAILVCVALVLVLAVVLVAVVGGDDRGRPVPTDTEPPSWLGQNLGVGAQFPHAHSTVSRCVLCSQQLVVRLHLTEVSRVHTRDVSAPFAGLIDLIMVTEAELLAERQLGVRAA